MAIKLQDGEEIIIEENFNGGITIRDQSGLEKILDGINFVQMHAKILGEIRDNPDIFEFEFPRELAVSHPKYPLTLAAITCLVNKNTKPCDVLLLRNAPNGGYLYIASLNDVKHSEKLQMRARQALSLVCSRKIIARETVTDHINAGYLINLCQTENFMAYFNLQKSNSLSIDSTVCSTPTEVSMRWITELNLAAQKSSVPKQKELILDLLQGQKNRWLEHKLRFRDTRDSLKIDSAILKNNGLIDLADIAFSKNPEKLSLVSRLPKETS